MTAKKIGLFFGSFNPIHHGHLMLATYLVEHTDLDKIWFVISPHNPFKKKSSLLADHHRLQLVNLSVEDNPLLEVSSIEFKLPQPSYTIDSLTYLHEKHPEKEFKLICGTDILPSFNKWKNFEEIIKQYEIYVYNRPGEHSHQYSNHNSFKFITAPSFDISSSFIRKSISEKKDIKYFLPDKVYDYIKEMHFYENRG
ncbi:MAG: nicotinate (nicotinamide) nucleotide adenylyltransferase [Bacteroidota bacterium]|nr:nicotinate (nicotinamide) nucleotide adenylyltransferase [Bacteroidota bacterium]